MNDFNQMIIPYYSPISAKGGNKSRRASGRRRSKSYKLKKTKHNASNKYLHP
jgi:hypothetical protein